LCTYLGFGLQKSSYLLAVALGLGYRLAAYITRATTVLILKATILPVQSIGIRNQKLPIREMDPKMKTRRR